MIKDTFVTDVMYGEDYIIISWVNKNLGFGEVVCDNQWKVVDDERMGKQFCKLVIKKAKNFVA